MTRTMSKHTPGPWAVDGPPWNQIVWSGPETRVCFLAHSNGRDDERDIATGRLIAAAPTMLDALKAVLLIRPINWDDDSDPEQADAWRKAEAALAAATQADAGEGR